jgi:hypothetical protein
MHSKSRISIAGVRGGPQPVDHVEDRQNRVPAQHAGARVAGFQPFERLGLIQTLNREWNPLSGNTLQKSNHGIGAPRLNFHSGA